MPIFEFSLAACTRRAGYAPWPIRVAVAVAFGILAPGVPAAATAAGCLSGGEAYLKARIRGALNLDIDWRGDRALECEGDAHRGTRGIRVSFAGPVDAGTRADAPGGRHLRLIFGIASAAAGRSGQHLPINVTVIVEGEQRLYSTLGDDKCTADELRQQPLQPAGAVVRDYRVTVRGFCVGPARSLTGNERIVVSRFDFSGRVTLSEESDK